MGDMLFGGRAKTGTNYPICCPETSPVSHLPSGVSRIALGTSTALPGALLPLGSHRLGCPTWGQSPGFCIPASRGPCAAMSKQLMDELEAQMEGLPILAPSWRKRSDQNKEEVTTAGWGSLGWRRVGARWARPMRAPHPGGRSSRGPDWEQGSPGVWFCPCHIALPTNFGEGGATGGSTGSSAAGGFRRPRGRRARCLSFERSLPDPPWLRCGRGWWRWLYRVSLRSNPEPTP